MKKGCEVILMLLFLSIVMATGCSKSESDNTGLQIPAYSVTSSDVVSIDSFLELVNNPMFSLVPASFLDGQISSTLESLQQRIKLYKSQNINIKRVNYIYSSKDKLGNSITLSCRLCYPVAESEAFDISSITLFSNIWTPDNSFIPTNFFCIDEFRVFHDAAVVIPDYQGYGSSNKSVTNYASPLTDARQSVEALLVAKDIISKESKASLTKDFYTDNIGVSRGGMVALAIQKYLDDYASKTLAREVNLKGTLFAEVNPFPLKRFDAMKDAGSFLNKTSWYLMIPSVYYNFPDLMGGLSYSDFFTMEFNNRRVLSNGRLTTMIDALQLQEWSLLEHMTAWGGFSSGNAYDILSPELCSPDGIIDEDSPQWQAFVRVAKETEYIPQWQLKHPLTVAFYTNDHMLSFAEVKELVNDLQSRSDQTVKLLSCDFDPGIIDDESTIHAMAAFYWMFYTASHATLY